MLRTFQRSGWVLLLVLLAVSAHAFSLWGPVGNGGDSYQAQVLTYEYKLAAGCPGGPAGYIGAPKNIGEEYRRNYNVLYYSCDQQFLGYFGSYGAAAIDSAFQLYSNYLSVPQTNSLNLYPLDVLRVNYRAQSLGLVDLKSETITLLTEALGLTQSDEWTWTLRDRVALTGGCPNFRYNVIQRNFDPYTWLPSKYVNGTLFTYYVDESCAVCAQAEAFELQVDPLSKRYSSITSFGFFGTGGFFTGLTRDDMGGFRYLMRTNNYNVESIPPNSELIAGGYTNLNAVISLSTVDLALFAAQALTNNGAALVALYPNLQLSSTSNYLVLVTTTNVVGDFTNLANSALTITNNADTQLLVTSDLALLSAQSLTNTATILSNLYPGLTVASETPFFTNVITTNVVLINTNTANASQIITNTGATELLYVTNDLALLAERSLTNTATILSNLYPGIIVATEIPFFTNVVSTNISVGYTNYPWSIPGSFPSVYYTTNYSTNVATYYKHTFVNVVTNRFYTNSATTTYTTNIINQQPYSIPGTFTTTVNTANKIATNTLNGTFYLLPTNICSYSIISTQLVYTTASTNLVINSVLADGTSFFRGVARYVTNYIYVVNPVYCIASLTNYTTNVVVNYAHTFQNVVTNSVNPNAVTTLLTTNITPCGGLFCTNITVSNLTSGKIAGDFYLLPTNVCGYSIVSNQLTTVFATTNSLSILTNGSGIQIQTAVVTYYTNHQYVVHPITCYAYTTTLTNSLLVNFAHTFDNVVTNIAATNSRVTILTTNITLCGGSLCTNITATDVVTNRLAGSIFILPTNQCGLSISSTQFVTSVSATNFLSSVTNSSGSITNKGIVVYSTNFVVLANPVTCSAPGVSNGIALRQGIDQIYFVRRDFDSLLGRFFNSVTNTYTLNAVINNTLVPQTVRRIVGTPDVLFSALDMNLVAETRTVGNAIFNTANVLGGLAGPGTIENQFVITFNKVGPLLINVGPAFLDEAGAITNFNWASFDATTNAPIVYPNNASIAQLESQIVMQINTSSLPNGTSGVAYPVTALTGTGGLQPYTWSVANNSASGLPAGLTLSSNGVISGTLGAGTAGTYDITFQLLDSAGRSVVRQLVLIVN